MNATSYIKILFYSRALTIFCLCISTFVAVGAMERVKALNTKTFALDLSKYNFDQETKKYLHETIRKNTDISGIAWTNFRKDVVSQLESNNHIGRKDCIVNNLCLGLFFIANVILMIRESLDGKNHSCSRAASLSLGVTNAIEAANALYSWKIQRGKKVPEHSLAHPSNADTYILLLNALYYFVINGFDLYWIMAAKTLFVILLAHSIRNDVESSIKNDQGLQELMKTIDSRSPTAKEIHQ